MMVVPGNAPVIQQDHALEPDLGRDSTESSAMGPDTEPASEEVGPELAEVRKLRELVRRLEIENQHPRTKSSRSMLGTNMQSEIHTGVDNHGSGLNGMEINNSINAITEKQELQIMADLHNQLSKIRKEEGESNCLKKDIDAQMQYSLISAAEELSSSVCKVEMKTDDNVRCSSRTDTSNSTERVGNLVIVGIDSSVTINEQHPNAKCGDVESLSNDADLDEVKVLELENCTEEEDSWLYVSPRKSITDQKTDSPLKWCRQVLDNPSPETEAACRTLINRLDQASRWKNLYCSPLASPSAHNLNTETGSCSNALNSPGHLKSTNKALLTCGSSGYLSMHSALSSQSSVDSELSTSDDSISMGYKLQDLTDVQVMARLQEESLRQDCASSSASVSRRSSSASLHSLRRGTYSDQEFDTYSLEDEDDYDCSLSYRSAHRYSPSPLSSPRCQSPSSSADYGRSSTSRIRPPRRSVQSPMQDRLKYANSEEEMRHSMPNLARTSLRALESVRSSRSLESDLQVPSSRIPRTQQRSAGLAPSKLRYSSGAGQSPLTVRQPLKAGSCTTSLLAPRQPVKAGSYTSAVSGVRKPPAPSLNTGSSSSSCTTRSSNMVTVAKNSPVKARTSVGGISVPKNKPPPPSRRFLQSAQTTEDDSWKDGCY
ncbi:SLAIN motif-containing protein-like isoform X1 [Falco peregrinus]|uniref:SLAIN motif-containing protein-like isoform X1 n=1 Tax=Falco peregrinus TaxID=8954 RepID=UPI00247A7891|nr:SLAIN motif-containing protein-like isoform X1 [Falco peregrinus]XP_055674227.1 SLAIN motif-containing protein-like isoform X1 [Falco peregrinus]XP_055674228.1 SLAIN motif-containing protein-like isoform X1 [Falco peregrinus]XP_055674229.1 SLAIN motif-containing protein-like isoform X1 [Falco peregrinus]